MLHFLGLTISADMKWEDSVKSIARAAASEVGSLRRARQFFSLESSLHIYKYTIGPGFKYCSCI